MFFKRIFLFLAIVLAAIVGSLSSARAKLFHGPYVGLFGTFNVNALKARHDTATLPQKMTAVTISLGVHGGYARTFENRMFLGFHMDGSYDGLGRLNKVYNVTSNNVIYNTSIKVTRLFSGGAELRAGYNLERFMPGALLYAGGGAIMTRFRVAGTLSQIGGTGKAKNQFLYGFGPVFGGEMRLRGSVAVGANYKYTIYTRKAFYHLIIRPKVNSFTLYGSYYF